MLKFFRRIRQQLLSENKFSKYLLYAVGEIVLVVIGILIALSINNWNEDRKRKKEEKDLYVQIIKDLDEDHELLQYHLEVSESLKAMFKNLYEYSAGKTDSLQMDSPALLFISINYSSQVLQNHESSVDRISSDSIRAELNKYLLVTKEIMVRREEEIEGIKEIRRPFLLNNNLISLDKLFNPNTEYSSVIVDQFKEAMLSDDFEYFVASGYGSNMALILYTGRLLAQNRALKQQLESSELMLGE